MEFLNSKNDLYLGGAVNQIDTLSGVEYICSSDSTQSNIPLSNYLSPYNGRVQNLSGYIAKVGLYNYVMKLEWEFTTAKSQYTTGEAWNLIQAYAPFAKTCKFGFTSFYKDCAMDGVYAGMLNYQDASAVCFSIWPFTNIVVADLNQYTNKTFRTTAFWTSF